MSFYSLEFALFFPLVTLLYFLLPGRLRLAWLLLASYFFYGYWNASYLLLIIFSTLLDYGVALGLGAIDPARQRRRRGLLALSILSNLGVLFAFKYFNFFAESTAWALSAVGGQPGDWSLDLLLPVGISFYTFQSMAYTIDIYRALLPPERNLLRFATYIAFFPQLVAGPIERAPHLLPQFRQYFPFDEARVVSGLRLILWGAFKKGVIANRLAVYVNAVYEQATDYQGLPLLLATLFFAFQIYCDFSGYSDIAIGVARVLGFDLMENFRQPYFAASIREFWRRWHISLSTWFRDYLYIPLGGNRVGLGQGLFNLLLVFVVSGLWHGAAWTFVIWGALHGGLMVLEVLAARWLPPLQWRPLLPLRVLLTFALVCFAWIFFRANSLADALYIVQHLFAGGGSWQEVAAAFSGLFPAHTEFYITLGLIAGLLLVEGLQRYSDLISQAAQRPVLRWAAYYFLAIAIGLAALYYGTSNQEFIYFQF